jgi:starch synthase (maltosyl-transferring)
MAAMPVPERRQPPPRIQLERPEPLIDCGRYPAKACVGDEVRVAVDAFRDGHEVLRVVVRAKPPGERTWSEAFMVPVDADRGGFRYEGAFPVDRQGRWQFTFEAWVDAYAGWVDEVSRKLAVGQEDLSGELSEGRVLVEAALGRAKAGPQRDTLAAALESWDLSAALDPQVGAATEALPDRSESTKLPRALELDVDRVRARFGAWYELFPRSWGGFAGAEAQIPRLADLGFDVLYFPPIHPIGLTNRKGRNNTLTAGPNDPGSPYAIGDATGGHDAIHPDLGTEDEFRRLCATGRAAGVEIALDLAINASADHPWLTEHPEWFQRRPDGTLKYAENPPKKYQDIYNVDWDSEDWRGLWQALHDVVMHWVEMGVHVFRVDNPHTKPLAFWEWLIAEVRAKEPDVIFLAEAFTKAPMMRTLAAVGFNQSYTYFTWKSSRHELIEYVVELAFTELNDIFRSNFFVNTPDILTDELQHGGPPIFHARLVLASTLSPSYGVYSGYEHFENVAVRPGSEEYLDSEKYEIKQRALDGPLLPTMGKLNHLRRAHPALQRVDTVRFFPTENEALIGYTKVLGDDAVIVVVNIDPRVPQEGVADIPVESGLPGVFHVRDAISEQEFDWVTGRNYVRLEPGGAHVLEVLR